MNSNYRMAEGSSRAMYNAEEVIDMITEDRDQEDDVGDLFFPGSDDEFGFEEVIVDSDCDGNESGIEDVDVETYEEYLW